MNRTQLENEKSSVLGFRSQRAMTLAALRGINIFVRDLLQRFDWDDSMKPWNSNFELQVEGFEKKMKGIKG